MAIKLSIIILAGNEERIISNCLKSCNFADEIVLVAANSNDNTKKIAQSASRRIKIIETNDEYNKHFSKWRNLGLKNATGDWILYIDADEQITPKLKEEILIVINNSQHPYYVIPRANYFLGKRVKHGGTYPDYVKRLFDKNHFKGYSGILHEEPIITGTLGYLKNDLLHFTHRDLNSMLQKTMVWTQMESEALYKSNHPKIVPWRIVRMFFTKLWERLIKQQMYLDGTVGWVSSIFEAFDTFIIYAKLWELQQKTNEK